MATYTGLTLWLKDKNTSVPEKLKLAKFAWGSGTVHIPNKQQQLLDFVSGLLVNKKKHGLRGEDILPTWRTLHTFLQVASKSANVKSSILQAVVEDLGGSPKVKDGPRQLPQDSALQQEVVSCACCLLRLPPVASAQFELLCSVLVSACQLKLNHGKTTPVDMERLILSVLPPLSRCQRAHLNQSQVLHTVIDKVLTSALKVIDKCSSHCAQLLQDFLLACLLHSDHLEAYSVYLRHTCGEPSPGQPKQPAKVMVTLFSSLTTLVAQPDARDAATKFIPVFLGAFVSENKSEARLCFLMLKRLLKLVTPSFAADAMEGDLRSRPVQPSDRTLSVDTEHPESRNGESCQFLETVALCLGVCQGQPDLDLFSASRQSGDILAWFSKLTHLVLQQPSRVASWFDFLRQLLGLNHLVVEKSWTEILHRCLAQEHEQSEDTSIARDQFLCELVTVYVRLRRSSDLLSALMAACLACPGTVNTIQGSKCFHARLCMMFNESPLTAVLDMWERLQAQTAAVVTRVAGLASPEGKRGLSSHLDWLLESYCCLLGNARLFDHRSAGAFDSRVAGLVRSVADQVIAPLHKAKGVKESCGGVERLLRTWSHLQVLLLPRWRGDQDQDQGGATRLRKWVKNLRGPDQARLGLQLIRVASPDACSKVQEDCAGAVTLAETVESLLELSPLTSDMMMADMNAQRAGNSVSTSAVSKLLYLGQLLPLAGARLPPRLLHACADLTLSILGYGHGHVWTTAAHAGDPPGQGEVTLLSLARSLLLHPAVRELRPFQQRLAVQAWTQLLSDVTFATTGPARKKKKLDRSTKEEPGLSRIISFLTDSEHSFEDIGELCLSKIDAKVEVSSKSMEMIKVLSCLDLDYLPEVNLRCQVGATIFLTALASRDNCAVHSSLTDQFKHGLERLYVHSMSVPNPSRLLQVARLAELLQFAVEYCAQTCGSCDALLEATVRTVMKEHAAVLDMPEFVRKLVSDLSEDTTRTACVKFQLMALVVKFSHKYVTKAYHIQQVGEAAREVFGCVAKFIIKRGLDWYQNTKLASEAEAHKTARQGREFDKNNKETIEKDRKKKKRKRDSSGMGGELEVAGEEDKTHGATEQGSLPEGEKLAASAWQGLLSCVTEVLSLWEEQAADAKVNRHLEGVVAGLLDTVGESLQHSNTRSSLPVRELLLIQSCCRCQLRSRGSGSGLQLVTPDTQLQLWTACFSETHRFVRSRLEEGHMAHDKLVGLPGRGEDGAVPQQDPRTPSSSEAERLLSGEMEPATQALCALLEGAGSDTFVALLGRLMEGLSPSPDLDPSTVIVAVETWRHLTASPVLPDEASRLLFKHMYQLLSSVLSTLQILTLQAGSPTDAPTSSPCDAPIGYQVASRYILRALADFTDLGKTMVTPRMTLLCLHAGFSLDLAEPADVEVVCRLTNALLVRHTNTALTAVPTVLDLLNKLLAACMTLGGQERLTLSSDQVPGVMRAAQMVTRLLTLLSSTTYKSELQKVAHSVLGEYVMGVQKRALHAGVKAELLRGVYKLMSVCDKFRLAALNAALPAGVKDTFKVMHQEYNKYHRYAGLV